MMALGSNWMDLLGVVFGFLLTVMVLSYVWGDNAFFRMAIHLFIGVTTGYVTIMVIQNVILPQMIFPLVEGNRDQKIFAILFLILGALMLTKVSPRLGKAGNPAIAYLVGVGAAAAIGGAMVGTISPQVAASMNIFVDNSWFNAIVILLGTLTTLIYFHFGVRSKDGDGQPAARAAWLEGIGWVGQFFVAITFGALFSGVYLAAITALIERISYLWNLFGTVLPSLFS